MNAVMNIHTRSKLSGNFARDMRALLVLMNSGKYIVISFHDLKVVADKVNNPFKSLRQYNSHEPITNAFFGCVTNWVRE